MTRFARVLIVTIIVALALAFAMFNWVNLCEAYGSGPPYYNRTTNMDKWANPLPELAAVDAVALLVVLALIYVIRRRKHAQTRK